jgi:DNA-binding CsgD family transcriptional regulator
MLNVLQAMYRLDLPDEKWATEIARALVPFLDRDRMGVIGFFYECRDACALKTERSVRFEVPDAARALFSSGAPELPPMYVADKYMGRPHSLGADMRGWDEIEPVKNGSLRAEGMADMLTINVTELDGNGCGFLSFRKDRSVLSDRTHVELTSISRHLAAAHRLRRALEVDLISPAKAAAVLDPDGTVRHAQGDARARIVRDFLARATRDMMRVRRGERNGRTEAVDGWRPMVAQRWSLIDHFERDGRRYVLAIENVGAAPSFDLLTARERQVLDLALQGRHAKAIAYELGIAYSTVRVLKTRMVEKTGLRSWQEVLERGRQLAESKDGPSDPDLGND